MRYKGRASQVSMHSTRKGKKAFERKRGNTFAGGGRYKQYVEISNRKGKERKSKQQISLLEIS